MNLETKITIYKFTPQVYSLIHLNSSGGDFLKPFQKSYNCTIFHLFSIIHKIIFQVLMSTFIDLLELGKHYQRFEGNKLKNVTFTRPAFHISTSIQHFGKPFLLFNSTNAYHPPCQSRQKVYQQAIPLNLTLGTQHETA